ncbi:PA14 domain-containing protein [Amycolatopsis aidingensis]|uniref:PA14 domain-containing protein n=1 Tax=Amycolatopsis aidingensis TaxID=2842453 RepID=UPI001E640AF0|nr:PA14 domain-containing protein [Amycolatopsis aidingensis]
MRRSRPARSGFLHAIIAVVVFALGLSLVVGVAAPEGARAEPGGGRVEPLPSEPGSSVRPEMPAGDYSRERPSAQPEKIADPDAAARQQKRGSGFVQGESRVVERHPSATIFANPDGTKTAKLYQEVVNVPGEDGRSMVPADASLERKHGRIKPKAAAVPMELPARTASSPEIQVRSGDGSGSARLEFEGLAERAPKLNGEVALYPDVQPGVDLELRTSATGVKHTFVLHKAIDDPEWTFRLHLDEGLRPRQQEDGRILVHGDKGRVEFTVPAPVMWDSAQDTRSGEWRNGPVSQRLESDERGWRVVLSADRDWINAPERQFPIKVDPGLHTHTLYAAYDAFVSSAFPTTNYDVYWEDGRGYLNKIGYWPGAGRNQTFAYYDLSHVRNKQIIKAEWHGFWVHSNLTTPTRFRLHDVPCAWNKSTITWNNRPCVGGAWRDSTGVRKKWSHVDITDWVRNFSSGAWAYHGLMIDTAGDGQGSWKKMAAAEAGPDGGASVVTVDFNDWPSQPANRGCSGEDCRWHTRNFHIGVDVTDPNSDPMTVQFFLSEDPDVMNRHFASHQAEVGEGGTVADWHTPTLQWNKRYYWQARVRDPYMPDNKWSYSPVYNFASYNETPGVPALQAPQDRAVVADKRPTLSAGTVDDAENDTVQYEFSIGTGADGRSGLVAQSGWLDTPSWQVPPGVLEDGVNYTWTVRSRDKGPDTRSLYAPARKLKVDLRLGLQDAVPGDETGPVNVNLSTGNLITTTGTPPMHTVGGDVSVDLTYNSQAVDETGLVGEYFTGDSTEGIEKDEEPVLVRTDSQVSFDWQKTSPYDPVIAKDGFRVRWQGYLRVPESGSYRFGGVHDDGLRIWIGDESVYDQWNTWVPLDDPPKFDGATARQLEANRSYPIRIEYREGAVFAHMKLWAEKDGGSPVPVPASWLSPNAPSLPPGWSMSVGSDVAGASYTKATFTENSVVLTDASGAAHSYTKKSDGGYAPPPGEYGTLSRDEDGRLTLIDSDGTTFVFNSSGGLESITAPSDARKPAAARMEWSTLDTSAVVPRLTKVLDPVSGRAITLHYSSGNVDTMDPACERDPWSAYDWPAPAGYLCAVRLPDGATSSLYYLNGKLGALGNPGGEWTQYGFGSTHLLDQMRTPLSMDWIMASPADRNSTAPNHQFGYDGNRRAIWTKTPEPSGFTQTPSQRQRKDYTYGPDWTEIDVAGMDPDTGFVRRITKDLSGRMLTDTDATGATTHYTWWHDDQMVIKKDPAGRVTHIVHDSQGNPMHESGPAPEHCFGENRIPLDPAPEGCEDTPHKISRYDEGYTGLSGTWWTNPHMSGAAETYSTSAPNTDWGSTPPAPGIDPDEFSGRMTGLVQVDEAGEYVFGTAEDDVTDGMRVYVDDNLVANRTYAPSVADSGPLAYWRLADTDGTLRDHSGNGREGAYSGGYTQERSGAMPDDNNRAVDFTGGKAEVPDADALDLTGPMTIELWVKPRHNLDGNGWHDLISKYGGSNSAAMPFELSLTPDLNMELRQVGGSSDWQWLKSDKSVVADEWSHVAVTRDAENNVTFYLNGEKVGEGTFAESGAANSAPLAIGRRPEGGTAQAELDEVALYDRELPEKEIAGHVAGAGTVNDGRKPIQLSAGKHRLRVEYQRYSLTGDQTRASDNLNFTWKQLGGFDWTVVPREQLTPDYGLVTSTTERESEGVPDKRMVTTYGENLDPAFGIVERATANPDGLAMAGTVTYETPGDGFLRRTTRTMPSGAQTSYGYYGDTETRDNPCTAEADPVLQSGLVKKSTAPSAADGTNRVEEQVYDLLGRAVADHLAGAGWACTTYDARGRIATKTYPANSADGERVVRYDYAVDGDPLTTSVSDHHGTVTTKTNLLGQTVSYTDVHGVRTEKEYDPMGRVATETVVLPDAADAQQVSTFAYDDAGRLLSTTLNDTTLATASYNQAGELASVAYANGSALSAVGRDVAGRETSRTWRLADGTEVRSAVSRTRAGTVVDESLAGVDARPEGPNYAYDSVGRMTEAYLSGHHYRYDFTSDAAASCPEGTRANAGRNTNRVALVDTTASGTAETGYCYDAADRLLATHGALAAGFDYDAAGNTVEITEGGHSTYLGWDTAGRNLTARTTGPEAASVSYQRDAIDRITSRGVSEGDSTAMVLQCYLGDNDNAAVTLSADKRLLSRTVSLPGGVLYTLRTGAGETTTTWDHPSVRGDLVLTSDGEGRQDGPLRHYGPYGQPIGADGAVDPDAVPDNQPGEMDYGWLGEHQRPYEHAGSLSLVQMGARPYSPLLGRFLSVDPNPEGSANAYEYAGANPVNTTDLSGKCWLVCDIAEGIGNAVDEAAGWVADKANEYGDYITAGLAVGCIVVSAGVCAVAGAAVAVTTVVAEGISTRHNIDWGKAAANLASIGGGAAAARYVGGKGALSLRNRKSPFVRKTHTTRYTRVQSTRIDWVVTRVNLLVNQFLSGLFGWVGYAFTCAFKGSRYC